MSSSALIKPIVGVQRRAPKEVKSKQT